MSDAPVRGRTALITGVTGQDGVYLARLLAAEGSHVIGTVRPGGLASPRIPAYLSDVTICELDIRDSDRYAMILRDHQPDEVYNLAAFTSVGRSWDAREAVTSTNAEAVTGLLQATLEHRDATGQDTHVFHASSATVSGGDDSPYTLAKAAAEVEVARFRATHGLHACFAKLHNHESPLRGSQFVTRKITTAAARIAAGDPEPLQLGNVDVRRDWGFAGDYVDAMRRMVRRPEPIDLEIGTGVAHSLRELVEAAFDAAGIEDTWQHIELVADLIRPTDAPELVADPGPAQVEIGWTASVSFRDVVARMVAADIARLETGVAEDPRYL
ncbi:MAG TPA: GDP-mannose 4,6-dehydratase [Aeromicrobium sp.]|nr:GDP-mannose 4,6-dehydratase [Aeromicrobium sp.]HKY59085.1 GDP-mannose 4,6-dehydratase [Aeromicrobium sp.]